MTPATTFAGRRVALFGLGGSGLATARALRAGGADVVAADDSQASVEAARAAGITTADLRDADWSGFAALVLAPGVPLTHPAPHWTVERAKAAGIEIIGDIELFCRERAKLAPRAPFVAITGTNGKSTTTALVAHILRQAGRDVQMGGNIGTPILALDPPANGRVHVIELSSFQIDLTPFFGGSCPDPSPTGEGGLARQREPGGVSDRATPPRSASPTRPSPGGEGSRRCCSTVGVLLNISPDHLDRHGTMGRYAAIKERVVAGADVAVVGIDDEPSRCIARRVAAAGLPLIEVTEQAGLAISDVSSLRGAHNTQNAAAATAVCRSLGLTDDDVSRGLRSFPGLAHRMEEVGRLGPAIFVNDSKATNADSTEKALLSFEGIHWILGGKPKEGGIEALRPLFTRVSKAYLIGEASDAFAATLEQAVPYSRCGTLDRAVAEAAADASRSGAPEPVVLLSPACASYDQFRNFEVRGERFRELVRALPGVEMRG